MGAAPSTTTPSAATKEVTADTKTTLIFVDLYASMATWICFLSLAPVPAGPGFLRPTLPVTPAYEALCPKPGAELTTGTRDC